MALRIAKQFDFDAAHWLPMVHDGHKCKRMHGHTYRVEVVLCGEVRDDGMVKDYMELQVAWDLLHDRIDHRLLNDIIDNPTTENLMPVIVAHFEPLFGGLLESVRVYESSTTWVEWNRALSGGAK